MNRPPGAVRLAVSASLLAAAFLGALVAADATPDLFRVSRPLSARPGWNRLTLPDDVLDACRPGLPDLRIFDANKGEVPFAFEERISGAPVRHAFRDVERSPGRETTALVDRGRRPPLARSATLTIDGSEWLKPVTLESSDDRTTWSVFAKGSVFSTRAAYSTTIRFAGNDRRWWRFRFDDRNGDPVTPREIWVAASESVEEPPREITLPVSPPAAEGGYPTVTLPAANAGVTALRVDGGGDGAAYSRRVRVWERIFFRGEVLRRPIGEGIVSRAPDGSGQNEIAICEPTARTLELEVERMDGPPLAIGRVVALARPRTILFAAPREAALHLAYGSALVDAPRYDVERALAVSRPRDASAAVLGAIAAAPAGAERAANAPIPTPDRGPALDPARWKWKQPIALPSSGTVAYLDLSGIPGRAEGAPRILDSAHRQVPYILERAAHRERRAVTARVSQRETRTVIEIPELTEPADVDAVQISATAPAYFSRQATVLEQEFDARGAAGTRALGSGSWEKRAENEPAPLTIAIARPASSAIRIEIENGDNAPLTIGPVAVWTSVPRIDFVYAPGEELTLVSGSTDVPAPRYDLELVASRVLSAPALPAKLASKPAPATPPEAPKTPKWLWVPVVAAAALVALVLARTLRAKSSGEPSSPPPASPAP